MPAVTIVTLAKEASNRPPSLDTHTHTHTTHTRASDKEVKMSIALPIAPRRETQLLRLAEKWETALEEYKRELERSEARLRRTRLELRDALATAHAENASLTELGELLGVSKQRVHQLLRED